MMKQPILHRAIATLMHSIVTKALGNMGRSIITLWVMITFAGTTAVLAQDRIITMEGEQISCRIVDEDSLSVVYMLHGIAQRSEVMPRYRIFRIERNLPEELRWVRKNRPAWESSRGNKMKGFKLSAGGGNGVLLKASGISGYEGTNGFNIKVDGSYFFGRFFGLGARYSMFRMDVLYVHFVSLNPTLRVPIRKGKAHFLFGFSGGYLQKAISTRYGTRNYNGTFGASFGGGFDVRIIPRLYIGLSGEFLVAFMDNRINRYGFTTAYTENLSRMDATLGMAYYF
jgi:hypothetical protein